MVSSGSSSAVQLRLVRGGARHGREHDGAIILHVLDARPNLVRMAPVIDALGRRRAVRQVLVHAGHHGRTDVADAIAREIGLPAMDCELGAVPGTHAEETAGTLNAFERLLTAQRPDVVVICGAANSALACGLAAAKLGIAVAHLHAGLRAHDATAGEINRVLTDHLSDTLLTPSEEAVDNLLREGVADTRVRAVGNTAVDVLRRLEPVAQQREAWRAHGVTPRKYVLTTMHAPANVDDPERLSALVEALSKLAARTQVIFPIHPRTRARLEQAGLLTELADAGVHCTSTLGYVDFLSLVLSAGAVVTDSGGLQDEASAIGVRCYTVGAATDRPITVSHGTNELLGNDPSALATVRPSAIAPIPCAIPLWDGRAGARAAQRLVAHHVLVRSTGP